MIYRIEYTKPASRDFDELEDYLRAQAGDAVADTIVRELLEGIESLQDRPERQRLRNELAAGVRAISVRSYMIFYRVDRGSVRIARILTARATSPRNCSRASHSAP